VTTDLSNGRANSQPVIVPKPSCIKARRVTADPALAPQPAAQISIAGTGSGRGTARGPGAGGLG